MSMREVGLFAVRLDFAYRGGMRSRVLQEEEHSVYQDWSRWAVERGRGETNGQETSVLHAK